MGLVPFHLITGFLGSGKTALLKGLLQFLGGEKRIAVIQNEFASTGIDGKELRRENPDFELIEVNNGSVFCVCQLGTFISSLEKLLAEYKPDAIFLEASGMSDPIGIAELLQADSIRDKVSLSSIVTVVDTVNYEKGMKRLTRFKHQIMVADVVLLNKMDLFEGDTTLLTASVKELNPFAEIHQTVYADYNWEQHTNKTVNYGIAAGKFVGEQSEGRPQNLNAVVLRSHYKLSEENLIRFIQHLQPKSPRMKGFMNLDDGRVMSVQTVFDTIEMKELSDYDGPSEFITFSEDLNAIALRKLIKQFA